jgi:membrane protease YdiL (CAAX protease family)
MENQSGWKAKMAFACYLSLALGITLGGIIVAFILLDIGLDYQQLSFPVALISIPINEGIILAITLLFAKNEGANLRKLGFKKPSLKIIVIISFAAFGLIFLAGSISAIEEFVLGPDPISEDLVAALLPRNLVQLVAIIVLMLVLVGPVEELAFRGFIQRGFENSYGKTGGLLLASVLFGLLHGLNSFRAIIPVTVTSLVLGYVWQKTDGNTTASAWMHGIYDVVTIAIAYFVSI